ncbi:hypothetical protein N9T71_02130 [Alphaproteobacteria bacterium]|nr:hypothetical protein [Alphaproteobacteria bacterium]
MFFIKKAIFLFLILSIIGCVSNNNDKVSSFNEMAITIDTPNDKYNIIFREYLKRNFNNKKSPKHHILLKASISFTSDETLSVSGISVLKSTKANTTYSLTDRNSNLLIKSGSINTFPALSSSSNSLYSNEKSIENIKERLSLSSAKKLFILTKMILRK